MDLKLRIPPRSILTLFSRPLFSHPVIAIARVSISHRVSHCQYLLMFLFIEFIFVFFRPNLPLMVHFLGLFNHHHRFFMDHHELVWVGRIHTKHYLQSIHIALKTAQ